MLYKDLKSLPGRREMNLRGSFRFTFFPSLGIGCMWTIHRAFWRSLVQESLPWVEAGCRLQAETEVFMASWSSVIWNSEPNYFPPPGLLCLRPQYELCICWFTTSNNTFDFVSSAGSRVRAFPLYGHSIFILRWRDLVHVITPNFMLLRPSCFQLLYGTTGCTFPNVQLVPLSSHMVLDGC